MSFTYAHHPTESERTLRLVGWAIPHCDINMCEIHKEGNVPGLNKQSTAQHHSECRVQNESFHNFQCRQMNYCNPIDLFPYGTGANKWTFF